MMDERRNIGREGEGGGNEEGRREEVNRDSRRELQKTLFKENMIISNLKRVNSLKSLRMVKLRRVGGGIDINPITCRFKLKARVSQRGTTKPTLHKGLS